MPKIIDKKSKNNTEPKNDVEFLANVPSIEGGIDTNGQPVVVNQNTGLVSTLSNNPTDIGTISYAQDFLLYITAKEPNSVIYINGENTFKISPSTINVNLTEVVANGNIYSVEVKKQGYENYERYEIEAVLTPQYLKDTGNSVSNLSPTDSTYKKYNDDGTLNVDKVSNSVSNNSPIYTSSPAYTLKITKYENGIIVPFDYNVDSQIRELQFNNFVKTKANVTDNIPATLQSIVFSLNGADQSVVYSIDGGSLININSGVSSITAPVGSKIKITSADFGKFKINSIVLTGSVQDNILPNDNIDSAEVDIVISGNLGITINVGDVITSVSNKAIITINETSLEYNVNSNTGLLIPIVAIGLVDKLTMYIRNYELPFDDIFDNKSDTALILIPHKYISDVGNYKVKLIPSNSFGLGDSVDILINVIDAPFANTPDIRGIVYPKTIISDIPGNYNVDFEISWDSINTDYIRIGKVDGTSTIQAPANGVIELNVSELLNLDGTPFKESNGVVDLVLKITPYAQAKSKNNIISKNNGFIYGDSEIINIKFVNGGADITKSVAINRISDAFISQLDDSIFESENSKYLTHLLHIDGGDNKIITTWVGDGDSLILKLYEPIPTSIQPNQQVWISKIQANPIIETITITGDSDKYCPPLKGANFTLVPDNGIGYKIFDELIASGSVTSNKISSKYLLTKGVDTSELNIQYVSGSEIIWKNFVHFGSAEERVNNFYYKIKLVENYQNKYEALVSSSASSSFYITRESQDIQNNINTILNDFDGFEQYLYNVSSSVTYPKVNGVNVSTVDLSAISWYDSTVNAAAYYDKYNVNYLTNNIPEFIREDYENSQFILFLDMIGQHFDMLWSYINAIGRSKIVDESREIGIPDKLVWHLLKSFGWDGKRAFDSQYLWEYAFGEYKDGSKKYSIPLYDANNQIWRRIINNLPYLLKYKGTARAIKAVMACYGVPQSMLTIMEFGGPQDPTRGGVTKFTFEDKTSAIHLKSQSTIKIPWKPIPTTTEYPSAIEFRIKPDVISDIRIFSSSGFSLDIIQQTGSYVKLQINLGEGNIPYFEATSSGYEYVSPVTASPFTYEYTSSFFPPNIITSVYSGITGEYALGPEVVTGSLEFPLSTTEYSQILINKHTLDTSVVWFEVLLATPETDRIKTYVSMSILTNIDDWVSGSEILVGNDFNGLLDEFRLWKVPLETSKFKNHTLFPDAINGNSVSSSTEDLIFRLDFEYPKDRTLDLFVKNVSISTEYDENYATASNFYSAPTYPYQYEPYERIVTADVPSIGISYANKIRFEETELIGELSHRIRATKKSFDRSPIDSSRLGLFFSPNKELNLDIVKSFGEFNVDNYVGDPSDEYNDSYKILDELRHYYFKRLDRNINEYIRLVKYIDKSLFDVLVELIPARAKVSKGLLIEPHYLERSKTKWNKPVAKQTNFDTKIDTNTSLEILSDFHSYDSNINSNDIYDVVSNKLDYEAGVEFNDNTTLVGEGLTHTTEINIVETNNIKSELPYYVAMIDVPNGDTLSFENAAMTLQQIGMGNSTISDAGFGLYAKNGVGIVKEYDIFGNLTQSRQNIYLVKEEYVKKIPTQISGWPVNGSSAGDPVVYDEISVTFHRYKVSKLPYSGSIETGNGVVSVMPLNGYFPTHYKYKNNLSEGMIRSFWKGSVQSNNTTPDGLPPVETFTTNPNILKVADTGRGSGEPILTVS
jgi:hypothetical protein